LSLILIASCSCSAGKDYQNIIHQFVELNTEMGVPKEDVGVLIANVKATLTRSKKAHENFFRTMETQCTSALALIDKEIKSHSDSVADATNQINTWAKNLSKATADRKDATANIKKARVQLKDLKKKVSKAVLNYRVFAEEADKKLNVVKILRDIINDELYNRAPGLVQVTKFTQKLAELKEMLNNDTDSLYSPIVSVLLDLATEQNFSDQSTLKKILTNLNNLDKALREFRTKQEKGLDEEIKTLRKEIKNIRQRIRAYRRMRHQASSKAIDANHYIAYFKHEVAHFTAEKNRMTAVKNFLTKLCDFQKTVHKKSSAHNKKLKTKTLPYLQDALLRIKSAK